MSTYHKSVLLDEAITSLKIEPGKKYIDGTLGGGGHSFEIVKRGGIVLSLDVDGDALEHVRHKIRDHIEKIKNIEELLKITKGNFRDIETIAKENGFEKVSGVLLDLGVSSHQFDAAERGFSIVYEGPLDMRMGSDLTVTAKDLIHGLRKDELEGLFFRYGEEHFAKRIAHAIDEARKKQQITTTKELAEIIKRSVPRTGDHVHPATRVFQALRIAVNDELHALEDVLPRAVSLLERGGRLVVISFHSLEDRIVKHSFTAFAKEGKGRVITEKPIVPSEEEIEGNSRSRSAKMRVFERS